MAKKILKGEQLTSLPTNPKDLFQVTMDLDKNDDLITQRGVTFTHWAAMPSPIGLKDIGDYRRSGQLDTQSSNGMIYKKKGCFTAAIVSNSKNKKPTLEGGVFDYSTARLIVPRFYNKDRVSDGEEIHLAPGDRIFIEDLEVLVPTYQKMEFVGTDVAQFPIKEVEFLQDSSGVDYRCGVHFQIVDGKISWINGKENPGYDLETGKGNIYSIRYKYNAHWYVIDIPNEVRVTQVTENGIRKPARMPYSAIIQREYVYYNQNNDGVNPENKSLEERRIREKRTIEKPVEKIQGDYQVIVDVNNIE